MIVELSPEAKRNLSKFIFLCDIPALDLKSTRLNDNKDCIICLEPYRGNIWQLGSTLDYPVTLPCRHIFGHQCLARWVWDPNFNNCCPLCTIQIVDLDSKRSGHRYHLVEASWAYVELLTAASRENPITMAQKDGLVVLLENGLRRRTVNALAVPIDRVKVALEGYLDQMGKTESEEPVRGSAELVRRSAELARGLAELAFKIVELIRWLVSVGLITAGYISIFVSAGLFAFCSIGWLWNNRIPIGKVDWGFEIPFWTILSLGLWYGLWYKKVKYRVLPLCLGLVFGFWLDLMETRRETQLSNPYNQYGFEDRERYRQLYDPQYDLDRPLLRPRMR